MLVRQTEAGSSQGMPWDVLASSSREGPCPVSTSKSPPAQHRLPEGIINLGRGFPPTYLIMWAWGGQEKAREQLKLTSPGFEEVNSSPSSSEQGLSKGHKIIVMEVPSYRTWAKDRALAYVRV